MGKPCVLMLSLMMCMSLAMEDNFSLIDKLRYDLIQLKNYPINQREARDISQSYKSIFEIYEKYAEKINNVGEIMDKRNLNSLTSLWPWAMMQKHMNIIDGIYSNFLQMLHRVTLNIDPVNITQCIQFANVILKDPNVSMPSALKHMTDIIIEQDLFILAYKEVEARVCNEKQSPQQLLFNLYNIIAWTELRGHTMMQFSYTILSLHDKEKNEFATERNKTTRDFELRVQDILRAVKVAMAFAPKELWKCDPVKHEAGKTYTELTQLFSGYIVNEVDLNPTNTCRENCGYYSYTKVHSCYDNQYCSQQRRCNGNVLNCQYIDSDMWVCPSNNKNRRYEYIEYENGKMYGKKNTCSKPTRKVDSWWRWLFWHCSYCMCYCDDYSSSSDRYFNLRDVTSDVENNKVITGLRLVKENQIIHIQIQEGKLLERGMIDNKKISWKPVDNYARTDVGVVNGRDYHTLTWEHRAIDLDDLFADDEHLLTGVRFRMVGAHLNFEIRVTPFNFTTGLLIKPSEKSKWMSNDQTEFSANGKRNELKLNKPDIPTRASASAKPDSKSNQFLNFGPTDLEKDAAQTTIPFLDIQPVETVPAFPLSGAGIFHKGRDGSGGYVALKIMTYDFTKHLRADFPPPPSLIAHNEITADKTLYSK
ncbi:hypothetical protein PV325_002210 [Microctonus aethiopoides]|uniref:Uncharacterized protein n=1 Tax=Microctonus aethiopoides TaxID=144406 RepID=A0AA39KRE1_9HYME|nr:hypothetical protein PV325_002210 [Microctonus aethiopoides]KAK0098770.1 hypothetical protein PV326_003431 [Microctonus aethiopoides]KAK0170964.1 hypothetical protein PV328_008740 [Microctonus aethiopoides]